ncbi:MAG TPA: beta-ketoacyl synthase N-terminal-like domain-containing protein [Polyangia bacterium]|jgi:3-oxoacyl-[acyl-carrier-protein] synthase II
MMRKRATDVVITGAASLTVAAGASIVPARWVGNPARLSRMDRLCGLALVACDGALGDAALTPTAAEWNGERTAIVFGTAFGCHATNEDYYRGLVREGASGASPRLFAYTLPSSPVGEISIHYGVRGPTLVVTNGAPSAIDALAEGAALVAEGRADRALVCAAEVATPLLAAIVGGALVDAAAALVIERAADAGARGATPRGRLVGSAAAFGSVRDVVDAALANADVPSSAARRLDDVPGALAAAPLIALARFLAAGERDAFVLVRAADDGGAASAAVVAT